MPAAAIPVSRADAAASSAGARSSHTAARPARAGLPSMLRFAAHEARLLGARRLQLSVGGSAGGSGPSASGRGLLATVAAARIDGSEAGPATAAAAAGPSSGAPAASTPVKLAPAVARDRTLLGVPGIGPRYAARLSERGLTTAEQLREHLFVTHGLNAESAVDFLRRMGICKQHATNIARNLAEAAAAAPPAPKRVTFCVEGNISVGKSTFLRQVAAETVELRDIVEVVPEPVDEWQRVAGKPEHNILDAFYRDPARFAYTFQNYVFVTRMNQETRSRRTGDASAKPLRLMERSVFSDRMVFVRAVHEARWMSSMELDIYDSWFDPFVAAMPALVPDGFIYLRADPSTCLTRLHKRARAEEGGVDGAYLRQLHEKHEQWLHPSEFHAGNRVVDEAAAAVMERQLGPLPLNLRDKVTFLRDTNSPMSAAPPRWQTTLAAVPTLVLDCDGVDLTRDQTAKEKYAKLVNDFFQYVKKPLPQPAGAAGVVYSTASASGRPEQARASPGSSVLRSSGSDRLLLPHGLTQEQGYEGRPVVRAVAAAGVS